MIDIIMKDNMLPRKKIVFVILFLIYPFLYICSQGFSIRGIEKLPTDMDARVNYARKDQNGKTCAIIKIATPLTGFSFDTGTLSVQYVVEKIGEIWVYVQPGIKKITIAHQSLGVVREWDIPIKIEEACSYALSLNTSNKADANFQVGNPQRIVLLTLKKHELMYHREGLLAFSKNGSHYACLTRDTLLEKDNLIVDGVKKVIANSIATNYIDPINFDKSVYCYRDGNKWWYFFIEGNQYGPYEGDRGQVFGDMYCSDMTWIMNGVFAVYQESSDKWDYYYRGEPWHLTHYGPFAYSRYSDKYEGDTIQSVNRKYKVMSNEFGTIIYNGAKYKVLQNQVFNSDWYQDIGILDDGRCIINYRRKGLPNKLFVFSNGKFQEISQGHFFNYKTNSIDNNKEKYGVFNRQIAVVWTDYDSKRVRTLIDSSNKHSFETCALYNYVLIDNKEYGHESAIYELYDENVNEFQWIALEDKELVMYRYRL